MPSGPLSIRLVLVGVVLPALVVAADEAMLAFAVQHSLSVPTTLAILGLFVVQTGVFSYVAGRWLPNWGWRLVVLCWSMLLINLLLFDWVSRGRWITYLLSLAFASGQIGALAAWATLGASAWWRRLAILSLAVVPVLLFGGEAQSAVPGWNGDAWRIIVLVQVIATWPTWDGPGPIEFAVPALSHQDSLVALDKLTNEADGKVVFLSENQEVWDCRTLTDGDDPPVWCYGDQMDERQQWFTGEKLICDSLSRFLTTTRVKVHRYLARARRTARTLAVAT